MSNDQVFETAQVIERPIDEVFSFFSNPRNLELITPPWLRFKILGDPRAEVSEGTRIDYSLRIRGFPIRWRSRIEQWEPGRRFVDTQTRGPYALWHHTHEFEEVQGGTRVTDRVVYRLPLGAAGRLVAGLMVRRDIAKIFDFRHERVRLLLEKGTPLGGLIH